MFFVLFSSENVVVPRNYYEPVFTQQYWADCRWINPSDPQDRSTVAAKLVYFQQILAPLQCSLDRILDVISTLRLKSHVSTDSVSDSDSDSVHALRPETTQLLPSLAVLGWLHFSPDLSPGQTPRHLPPLSYLPAGAVSLPYSRAELPQCASLERRSRGFASDRIGTVRDLSPSLLPAAERAAALAGRIDPGSGSAGGHRLALAGCISLLI